MWPWLIWNSLGRTRLISLELTEFDLPLPPGAGIKGVSHGDWQSVNICKRLYADKFSKGDLAYLKLTNKCQFLS